MVKIRKISKKEDDKKPSGVLSKGSLRFNSDQPHHPYLIMLSTNSELIK
jgi:hypothetical protein